MTTFTYTGSQQTTTLTAGKRYKLELYGAMGGGTTGGKGGYVSAEYTPLTSTTLYLYIGQHPTTYLGGWNGGGNGEGTGGMGYGGGGATDIRVGGTALTDRILVAAGGGGEGEDFNYPGGLGGGLTGGNGQPSGYGVGGSGGTQSAGGADGGTLGVGGSTGAYYAGGGGGGYYGGGGSPKYVSAGGGGSSYFGSMENGTTTSGVNEGDGYIVITEMTADTPQIFTQII